jgi:hypothetical protein
MRDKNLRGEPTQFNIRVVENQIEYHEHMLNVIREAMEAQTDHLVSRAASKSRDGESGESESGHPPPSDAISSEPRAAYDQDQETSEIWCLLRSGTPDEAASPESPPMPGCPRFDHKI